MNYHLERMLIEERERSLNKDHYIKKLENELEQVKEDLFKYQVAVCIRNRVRNATKNLCTGYDEESFIALMRNKYADADRRELKEKHHTYRRWQYIIHFAENVENNLNTYYINKYREMFGGESKRHECHVFCLSMKLASKFSTSDVQFYCPVLTRKDVNRHTIAQGLHKFNMIDLPEIENILTFIDVNEYIPGL